MIEVRQKTIDGVSYTCRQMPAMMAAKALVRIARTIGHPSLRLIAEASGNGGKASHPMLLTVVGAMFDRLDEEEFEAIVKDLMHGVLCDRLCDKDGLTGEVLPQFDVHFQGRIRHLLEVVAFALEANYADFTDVLPFQIGVTDEAADGEDRPEASNH